jgi:hypothetical protein
MARCGPSSNSRSPRTRRRSPRAVWRAARPPAAMTRRPEMIKSDLRVTSRDSHRADPTDLLDSSRWGCFCAQKPFAQNSLQQSLDVKHFAPRPRHSDAPGACSFVTPVGFDPAHATRAAATTTAETSCFMGATSSPQPKQRAGHRSVHTVRERDRACHRAAGAHGKEPGFGPRSFA